MEACVLGQLRVDTLDHNQLLEPTDAFLERQEHIAHPTAADPAAELKTNHAAYIPLSQTIP